MSNINIHDLVPLKDHVIVTTGKVRRGDKVWHLHDKKWERLQHESVFVLGKNVSSYYGVCRIPRVKSKADIVLNDSIQLVIDNLNQQKNVLEEQIKELEQMKR